MQLMVFFEGLDKTGKTTLHRGLAPWRRDRFTYFDRGPWSRLMLGAFYDHRHALRSTPTLIAALQHRAVVVHVMRDFDTLVELQRGDERNTRPQLETQLRLFHEAFAAHPPAHLITIENAPGLTPAAFIELAKDRLSAVPDGLGRRASVGGAEGLRPEGL